MFSGIEVFPYWVECPSCGAKTGRGHTQEVARDIWNSRYEKHCFNCTHNGKQRLENGPCVGCTMKKDKSEPNGKRPSMWDGGRNSEIF